MGGRGSGRSSHYDELDFEQLIRTSLMIQMRFFNDEKIPNEKKVEYASRYLQRRVGEKIEMQIEHTLNQDQIGDLIARIKKLAKPQEKITIIDATTSDTGPNP